MTEEENKKKMYSLVDKPKQVKSFAQIMSEQELGVDEWPTPQNQSQTGQKNSNQQQTSQESTPQESNEKEEVKEGQNQEDEDFLFAMQLQEQLDLEERLNQQKMYKTTNEKVQVGNKKNIKYVPTGNANILDFCIKGDEYDEEEYEEEEEEEEEETQFGDELEKQYVSKVISSEVKNGRLPKMDHMISKHDTMMDSIKKAEEIDYHWKGNSLGDMDGTRISGKVKKKKEQNFSF